MSPHHLLVYSAHTKVLHTRLQSPHVFYLEGSVHWDEEGELAVTGQFGEFLWREE